MRSYDPPPVGFDPRTASEELLRHHGLPRRPDPDREPSLVIDETKRKKVVNPLERRVNRNWNGKRAACDVRIVEQRGPSWLMRVLATH